MEGDPCKARPSLAATARPNIPPRTMSASSTTGRRGTALGLAGAWPARTWCRPLATESTRDGLLASCGQKPLNPEYRDPDQPEQWREISVSSSQLGNDSQGALHKLPATRLKVELAPMPDGRIRRIANNALGWVGVADRAWQQVALPPDSAGRERCQFYPVQAMVIDALAIELMLKTLNFSETNKAPDKGHDLVALFNRLSVRPTELVKATSQRNFRWAIDATHCSNDQPRLR
jgi:hypothetical protein